MIGFYDPCINEPKQLRVLYKFKNRLHEIILDDLCFDIYKDNPEILKEIKARRAEIERRKGRG